MSTRPDPAYFFGLDLGQSSDPSGLVINEQHGYPPSTYDVRHIHRWELKTPYQQIALDVAAMYRSPALGTARRHLVVDATGVGAPVLEMLDRHRLEPVAIQITAGYEVTRVRRRMTDTEMRALDVQPTSGPHKGGDVSLGEEYRVPKRELAQAVQLVLQSERLRIAAALPYAEVLRQELEKFRIKRISSDHATYEAWREQDHDDLVLAAACAIWYAETEAVLMEGPPTRRPQIEEIPLGQFPWDQRKKEKRPW